MNRGVTYVAYGAEAIKECLASIDSLKRSNPGLPVCVLTDEPRQFRNHAKHVCRYDGGKFGRNAKLNVDSLSPFDCTLYLDADTRVYLPLDYPFQLLEMGFEFVATLSANQGDLWLRHLKWEWVDATEEFIGYKSAAIQGGVFAFRKTPCVQAFFRHWRGYFEQGDGEHEQDAMQKAWHVQPMRAALIGREWNGGAIVAHHYAQARRKDVK